MVFEYIWHNSTLLSLPLAIALVADTENPYWITAPKYMDSEIAKPILPKFSIPTVWTRYGSVIRGIMKSKPLRASKEKKFEASRFWSTLRNILFNTDDPCRWFRHGKWHTSNWYKANHIEQQKNSSDRPHRFKHTHSLKQHLLAHLIEPDPAALDFDRWHHRQRLSSQQKEE